ncbi:hypothetical protein [Runella sp.]|uniref:hypothetical protein n=1 Tax=Runella sp. TaxID=1960881 RepID=UPI003D0A1C56
MTDDYLKQIADSLKVIEFHLSDLTYNNLVIPDTEFWNIYFEIRGWIYQHYGRRIIENLYIQWHNQAHYGLPITVATIIEYAHLRKTEIDKLLEEYER